jgi:hypothetical protein
LGTNHGLAGLVEGGLGWLGRLVGHTLALATKNRRAA